MPLVKGKSKKAVSKNISTLVGDFEKRGRIGTSKPASKEAAVKQATAIALQKAGRAKPRKYSNGGFINEPTNYSVGNDPQGRPVNYVQQLAEEERIRREMARGAAAGSEEPRQAEEREQTRFSPAANMPGAGDPQYQTFRRTRPNVRFYPEEYDVARNSVPRRPAAMKKGGKVSAKKANDPNSRINKSLRAWNR